MGPSSSTRTHAVAILEWDIVPVPSQCPASMKLQMQYEIVPKLHKSNAQPRVFFEAFFSARAALFARNLSFTLLLCFAQLAQPLCPFLASAALIRLAFDARRS